MARAPARWEWEIDVGGSTIAPLTNATGRVLSFGRSRYGEAQCSISHEDRAAHKILDALEAGQWPSVRCFRWGRGDTTGQLRYRGFLAPFSESLSDSSMMNLTFRGPFWRLQGEGDTRGRYTPNFIECTAKDAGAAAASLVKLYGGKPGGVTGGTDANFTNATGAVAYEEASYCGLDIGTIETTVTRSLQYQYANVGESILSLTTMLDGFDFEERYVDSGATLAMFDVKASMGSSKLAARFEHGNATLDNCRSVTREWEPPINYVRLVGAYGLVSVKQDATSVSGRGKWMFQATRSDIFTQAELDAAAWALLRPFPVRRLSFVPDLAISPRPWDDFWLGDSVQFYGRRGAFEQEASLRVNQITVPIDDEGRESAEIPDPQTLDEEQYIEAGLSGEVV